MKALATMPRLPALIWVRSPVAPAKLGTLSQSGKVFALVCNLLVNDRKISQLAVSVLSGRDNYYPITRAATSARPDRFAYKFD